MIVSRKPCYMRKYQRYNLRDSEAVRVIISSLGITGECQLADISMNGMGVLIEGLSFSVIDESVVTIRLLQKISGLTSRPGSYTQRNCIIKYSADAAEWSFLSLKNTGSMLS